MKAHPEPSEISGNVHTNNRAEYMAVLRALETADELDWWGNKKLCIYTDS